MQKILFLTVGGSHIPVLQSIEDHDADHVVFFATGIDEATNNRATASMSHVKGVGCVMRSKPGGPLDLPNIPTQANLQANRWVAFEVLADDLDESYRRIHAHMAHFRSAHPTARFIADYSGGTKTMTAALCLAALECGAQLSVVTGPRADLFGVTSGQGSRSVTDEQIRFSQLRLRIRAAWKRFAFDEVLQLLRDFGSPANSALRVEAEQTKAQAKMLDAWDRFNYQTAISAIQAFEVFRQSAQTRPQLRVLELLERAMQLQKPDFKSATVQEKKRAWHGQLLLLNDLWLNAQRRGIAQRYDDAAARWYRLIEWTAQSWLKLDHDLDTGDLDPEKVPVDLLPAKSRDNKYQVGLMEAWSLLAAKSPSQPICGFFELHRSAILERLEIRNYSLLAHGTKPVSQAEWQRLASFTETQLLPVLHEQAKAVGAKLPEQWSKVPAGPFLNDDKLVKAAASTAE